eukprot:CAMPEP_0176400760 /NCGR_PEP_ID=MMETSP0126-20121128/47869_1 /TAXON_ID=141414 ORGANISM="Strombidinopsis acuminatum, Strain SPMC142" /NCGR_SAMPLE_ID=MMETSP0126 /ASSEMBLY_ACC=CAM_ASM_000229 /LENGTH=87 /DNA_ID=CAMNT_0017777237 /DNA_START=325 /DNA_END=588 /DNA_ORIENTATION=-
MVLRHFQQLEVKYLIQAQELNSAIQVFKKKVEGKPKKEKKTENIDGTSLNEDDDDLEEDYISSEEDDELFKKYMNMEIGELYASIEN